MSPGIDSHASGSSHKTCKTQTQHSLMKFAKRKQMIPPKWLDVHDKIVHKLELPTRDRSNPQIKN